MAKKLTAEDELREQVLVEQVCEGVHTALRKACDSKAAHAAWTAIQKMPDGEWEAAVRWAAPYVLKALDEVKRS